MKRLRALWASVMGDADRRIRLGRMLGFLFVVAGFIAVGKAWDGAANLVRVDSQFPYLLSGGFMGLGLIITGCTLLLLSTVRAERQIFTEKFDEMTRLLSRNLSRMQFTTNGASAATGQVVAAGGSYHEPGCRVLEGKQGLTTVTVEQAANEGLTPCRVCDPPPLPEKKEETVTAGSGTPDQ